MTALPVAAQAASRPARGSGRKASNLWIYLLLIGGLRQGLMTFYQQSKSDAEREQVFRATMSLLVLISVVGGGLIMALAGPVCNCLQSHGWPIISADLMRLGVLGRQFGGLARRFD